MKRLLVLVISLFSFSLIAGSFRTDEALFVHDTSPNVINLIKKQRDLTIDHVSSLGFELYGPVGLKKWLDQNNIMYSDLEVITKENSADYPTIPMMEAKLKQLADKYPEIMQLISIGKSSKGRNLWFVKISDNVRTDEVEPEVKLISSMHGDEITGRESMMFLIEDLLNGYGGNSAITNLINNSEIYIMPTMNPDGNERRTRGNGNNVDLNRDFPDFSTSDNVNSWNNREIETKAIMQFQKQRNFSLSTNFHTGAEVVNYPWDTAEEPHPYDALVKSIALAYSSNAPYIYNSHQFSNGITNGYAWYEVNGGMQDWSYYYHDDLQFTVELSSTKWPSYSQMPYYYNQNKKALLVFLQKVHQGVGFKYENRTQESGVVHIDLVQNRTAVSQGDYTFSNGEFYKILPKGTYRFIIKNAKGESATFQRSVVESVVAAPNYEIID